MAVLPLTDQQEASVQQCFSIIGRVISGWSFTGPQWKLHHQQFEIFTADVSQPLILLLLLLLFAAVNQLRSSSVGCFKSQPAHRQTSD